MSIPLSHTAAGNSRIHGCLGQLIILATGLLFPSAMAQTPNVELPRNVVAPDNQLTLFADYADKNSEGIRLYLINRTTKPISLDSQDGDIYVKLERRLPDGTWERAQPHESSTCGNSYFDLSLPPDQHFSFRGYAPDSGEKAHVRYAGYGGVEIVSNEGEGFVLPAAIEMARRDALGSAVLDSIELDLEPERYNRENPTTSPESIVAALRLLRVSGANPHYQEAAAEFAKAWETDPKATEQEKQAARAIRQILADPWPKKRDLNAVFERCLEALRSPKANKGQFGAIEANSWLVWRALQDLAGKKQFHSPAKWKPLVDFCLAHPTPDNIQGIISLSAYPHIGDELLPTLFFETHIFDFPIYDEPGFHASDFVWPGASTCVEVLRRRGEISKLVELGWKLPPKRQIKILQSLARDQGQAFDYGRENTRQPDSETERLFWKYCLKTQPLQTANALRTVIYNRLDRGETNPFGAFIHRSLRDYLEAEVEKAAKKPGEFSLGEDGMNLRLLVDFVAGWNDKDDTPLLQKLLAFNGYESSSVRVYDDKRRAQIYRFGVRGAASQALAKRGQTVPKDLTLEKEVPMPAEKPKSGQSH